MSQTRIRQVPNQKYIPAVLKAATQAGLQPGGFYTTAVLHDDWCGIYRGGDCNCDPIVEAPVRHTTTESAMAALARKF
jgi:hypothetical protein